MGDSIFVEPNWEIIREGPQFRRLVASHPCRERKDRAAGLPWLEEKKTPMGLRSAGLPGAAYSFDLSELEKER
jgi:hypothetical protein